MFFVYPVFVTVTIISVDCVCVCVCVCAYTCKSVLFSGAGRVARICGLVVLNYCTCTLY